MKNNRSLITLISVFFFWGFVAASNTVLIGLFKKNFELSQFQSQLVDLAFYAAYFFGSLIYFLISSAKGDPLNKIGYKKGLIIGLTVSAIGALGFIPAGLLSSFPLMLTSLFTIGLGFALQQIVANPYVIALGDPSTGAHRNMLAGGVNSFGTTIGPLIVAVAIYGSVSGSKESFFIAGNERVPVELGIERTTNKTETLSAEIVPFFTKAADGRMDTSRANPAGKIVAINADYQVDFSVLYGKLLTNNGKALLIEGNDKKQISEIVSKIKEGHPGEHMPVITASNEEIKKLEELRVKNPGVAYATAEVKFLGVDAVILPSLILALAFLLFAFILWRSQLPPITNSDSIESGFSLAKYPQLIYGMIAIFVYVGVEVAIQSNMPELMRREFGREAHDTVHFISLYWGGLMIGRWVGALTVFNLSKQMKTIMTVVVPFIVFGVILLVNYIKGSPIQEMLLFTPFLLILIVGFFMAAEKPARTMILFGSIGALMILTGLFIQGKWSVFFFLSGGLFCSVMWPCIFSLSIAGLGKHTTQGSSLLIMMILGGALIPPLQGYIADANDAIKASYVVPLIGFLYLAFYGWKVNSVLKKRGINYETNVAAH